MKYLKILLPMAALAILGAGCEVPEMKIKSDMSPTAKAGDEVMCPQTPQVFFFNKLAFTGREVTDIYTNVVNPLVSYYAGTGEYQVVSVSIKRTDTGIIVDAIIDQNESDDPINHGFVHPRVKGTYPMWYPEEVPPEYRG